jgi:hypothetical protein
MTLLLSVKTKQVRCNEQFRNMPMDQFLARFNGVYFIRY